MSVDMDSDVTSSSDGDLENTMHVMKLEWTGCAHACTHASDADVVI